MKQFISKNAMALIALVIAAGSYGLMSFGNAEDLSVQTLHWYEKNPTTGVYSPSPGNQPPSNCQPIPNAPICALGFEEPQSEVDDSMEDEADAVLNRSN